MASFRLRLLSALALATVAAAASTLNRRSDEYDDSSYASGSSTTGAGAISSQAQLLAQERLEAAIEKAHGVLGCLAFALLFPVGGMLLRLLPGRLALWTHAAWQVFAWLAALTTLAMGVWMAQGKSYIESTHAILGIFVIVSVSIQPLTGYIHHVAFKRTGGRTLWSYAHMFLGIPVISLGAINGGLGLQLAGASSTYVIVYAVFAVLIWVAWMAVSAFAQIRRRRSSSPARRLKPNDSDTERMRSSDGAVHQTVRDKEMRNNYE